MYNLCFRLLINHINNSIQSNLCLKFDIGVVTKRRTPNATPASEKIAHFCLKNGVFSDKSDLLNVE